MRKSCPRMQARIDGYHLQRSHYVAPGRDIIVQKAMVSASQCGILANRFVVTRCRSLFLGVSTVLENRREKHCVRNAPCDCQLEFVQTTSGLF